MNEKLEELEKRRQEANKSSNRFGAIGLGIIVIGVVLFFLGDIWSIIGIILFLVGAVFFGRAAVIANKFAKEYKNMVVTSIVKEELGETAIYQADGKISLNEIMQVGILQKPDRFFGEDYVRAVYNDVDFEMSDITLQEEVRTTDGRGHVRVSYQTYFKGRFFIFDFNKEMNRVLYVMPGKGKPRYKDLVKFDTESIEFNKKFESYASTTEDGFYLLNPKMIDRMIQLTTLYKGKQYYVFLNGKLYVAINNGTDSLEVSMRKKIDENSLNKTRSDIRIAPAIINEFGLNRSKFTMDKEVVLPKSEVKDIDEEILSKIDSIN